MNSRPKRILLVDDQPRNLLALAALLELTEFIVHDLRNPLSVVCAGMEWTARNLLLAQAELVETLDDARIALGLRLWGGVEVSVSNNGTPVPTSELETTFAIHLPVQSDGRRGVGALG